jgi:hypothetical protein
MKLSLVLRGRRPLLAGASLVLLACSSASTLPLAPGDAGSLDGFDAATSPPGDAGTPDTSSSVDSGADAPAAPDASDAGFTACADGVRFAPAVAVSDPNDTAFPSQSEVAVAARGHVAIAVWMAINDTGVFLKSATSIDEGPFSTPVPVDIDQDFGDPTVGIAPDGTIYVASICGSPANAICIVYSTDQGHSYSSTYRVSDPVADANTLRDRPWLAVGPDGRVVVTFFVAEVDQNLNLIGPASLRYAVGQRDANGMTFAPSVSLDGWLQADAGVGDGGVPNTYGYSGTLAFDSTGALHFGFEVNHEETTFSIAHVELASDLSTVVATQVVGPGALPVVATAGTSGELAMVAYDGALTHIVLLRSHDNGRTFDAPVPLSTDGDDIYVPWIGGDDAGGFHVMWDERTTGTRTRGPCATSMRPPARRRAHRSRSRPASTRMIPTSGRSATSTASPR